MRWWNAREYGPFFETNPLLSKLTATSQCTSDSSFTAPSKNPSHNGIWRPEVWISLDSKCHLHPMTGRSSSTRHQLGSIRLCSHYLQHTSKGLLPHWPGDPQHQNMAIWWQLAAIPVLSCQPHLLQPRQAAWWPGGDIVMMRTATHRNATQPASLALW